MSELLPSDSVLSGFRITIRESLARKQPVIITANALLALVECAEALRTVPIIAGEAFDDWDNDRDMRVGKILKALSGRAPRYRNDIDPIHYALAKLEAL